MEKEKVTSTIPKNIAQNITTNTLINSTGGFIDKFKIANKLNNFKATPESNPRQYRKMQDLSKQYYDNYISGTSVQKDNINNNTSSNIKPLRSTDEFLEEIRRKRRRRGW